MTSTYFEGLCEGNPQAQRGYSRDKRSDCKQVCIGLVVTRGGIPIGYEVFAGNRNDVTTWQEIVTTMEARYGRANRIWCGDRGMMSQANLEFMESGDRRYIIGASKGTLKKFERELLEELADDPRRSGSEDVPPNHALRPTAARKRTSCAAAAIAVKRKRRCTSGSSVGSTRRWKRSGQAAKSGSGKRK